MLIKSTLDPKALSINSFSNGVMAIVKLVPLMDQVAETHIVTHICLEICSGNLQTTFGQYSITLFT